MRTGITKCSELPQIGLNCVFPRNWYISKTSSANVPNIFTIATQVAYITDESRKNCHKDIMYLDRTSLNFVFLEIINVSRQ